MKSEDRARQILDCAKKVFAERGFHAANVSHICAEAGIGRGTLYLYFRNKKSVFEAILRETLDRVRALIKTQRPATVPVPEDLPRREAIAWSARKLHEILATVFQDERTLRILLREAVGLDVDIEKILGQIDDGIIQIVADQLAAAQKAGLVRPLDPRVTAVLMVGGIEKLAIAALRSDEPVDLRALAREAARFHATGTLSDRLGSSVQEGRDHGKPQ
jgi:AcrR family transcriptional regulator